MVSNIKKSVINLYRVFLRPTKTIDSVINKNPKIIAIVSPNFRGVRSATKEMVTDLYEASEIYSRAKAKSVARKILLYKPQKVLISGYALGHDMLAEELKKLNPNLRIFLLVHSAFIWFDLYPSENLTFEHFFELAKSGVIEKIGFCKRDLAEHFKSYGIDTYFVMNRFENENYQFKKLTKNKINIGIFGQNHFHRNITNQVIGALMLPDARVHVNEVSQHFFIDKKRIVEHGILPKPEFLKLYNTIDINLYISLTDCFPMTVIESMQHGIPCLVSDTSEVYGFSPNLKKWLTVSTIDGPIGISEKIKDVIKNYDDIQSEIKKYLPVLKTKVEVSIEEFLK